MIREVDSTEIETYRATGVQKLNTEDVRTLKTVETLKSEDEMTKNLKTRN